MVGGGHEDDFVAQESGGDHVLDAHGQRDDPEIERAVADRFGDVVAAGLQDVEPDSGVLTLERRNCVGEQVRDGGCAPADADHAALEPQLIGDAPLQPGVPIHDRAGLDQHLLAEAGECDAVRSPNQERRAELDLELLEPTGKRRLTEVESRGGFGDRPCGGRRDERAEDLDLDICKSCMTDV
jgi:hypothetical protein